MGYVELIFNLNLFQLISYKNPEQLLFRVFSFLSNRIRHAEFSPASHPDLPYFSTFFDDYLSIRIILMTKRN